MRTRRKDCIHRDYDGRACHEKQIQAEDAAREPANAEYCWEHRPVHQYDHDPACWSCQLPEPSSADPWTVLADWQEDRCGICGRQYGSDILEHDHQTGLIRGWVCLRCNNGEGRCARPRSRYARWRAGPATAILDLLLPYNQMRGSEPEGDIEQWTGKTYLPAGAPATNRWPHAFTCEIPPEMTRDLPGLRYRCDHPHLQSMVDAFRCPTSDGETLYVAVPKEGQTRLDMMYSASAALGAALAGESAS